MSRRGWAVGAVVLGTLVVGAVAADVMLRARAELQIAEAIREELPGSHPRVTISGTPFLTQLAAGSLSEVGVTAAAADLDGVVLRDVVVELGGVSTSSPTTAEAVWLTGEVDVAGLQEVIGVEADLVVDGQTLVATFDMLGLPIELVLVPSAAGRAIAVEVRSLTLAGVAIAPEDVPGLGEQLSDLEVPVDALPEGLELTEVVVVADGLRITATGADVVLASSRTAD